MQESCREAVEPPLGCLAGGYQGDHAVKVRSCNKTPNQLPTLRPEFRGRVWVGKITRANRDGTFDADIIDSNGNKAELEDIVRNCIGDKRCQGAVRKRQGKSTGEQKFGKQNLKQASVKVFGACLVAG